MSKECLKVCESTVTHTHTPHPQVKKKLGQNERQRRDVEGKSAFIKICFVRH